MSSLTLAYTGKYYDPRISTYAFKFGYDDVCDIVFKGSIHKHNGQFTDLDLQIDHPISGQAWCIFYGKILANNNNELREIIKEKISIYRREVAELVAHIDDACEA